MDMRVVSYMYWSITPNERPTDRPTNRTNERTNETNKLANEPSSKRTNVRTNERRNDRSNILGNNINTQQQKSARKIIYIDAIDGKVVALQLLTHIYFV